MDRFIVGTGRCGSTLLSQMVGVHPRTLDVSEFFNGLDGTKRFRSEPLDGPAFADLICAEHPFVTMVLRRGYPVAEIRYPFERPGARFRREDGVPWILGSTLPRITDDPDALYDEVRAWCMAAPPRPPALHYQAFFDWLAKRFGKEVWVERSGASIDYVAQLDAAFPDARFLHIHRAGEECALSMREHHAFRLAVMMMYQLPPDTDRSIESLQRIEASDTTVDASDPISQLLASRPDVAYFGRWWTDQVLRGFRGLSKIDADQYHEIRFEDLIADPDATLREVADFLELPDADGSWRAEAAALVHGAPETRFPKLPEEVQERLAEACRPGNRLLGRG